MPLRVNNNIAAINASRRLNANNRDLSQRLERLSSGLRINRASDDAAGLSVREGMRAEISGLKMNVLNAEQATNLLQVAEGSLNEISAMLIRMRELAVQSSSDTVNNLNRESIQAEFSQIKAEIDRVARSTTYNDGVLLTGYGKEIDLTSSAIADSSDTGVTNVQMSAAATGTYTFEDEPGAGGTADGELTLGNGTISQTIRIATLLDSHAGGGVDTGQVATGTQVVANFDRLGLQVTLAGPDVIDATSFYTDGDLHGKEITVDEGDGGSFQVGPDAGENNTIEVSISDMQASGDTLNLNLASVSDIGSSRDSITAIDEAINTVANQRGDIGAVMNRLSFTISFTENEIENIQSSEASISDADVASEVTAFTRAQILSQAATAMLSQANVVPQTALSLLQ